MDAIATFPISVGATEDAPGRVSVNGSTVTISHLTFQDEAVAEYLAVLPEQEVSRHLVRAIGLGVHGLATTGMQVAVENMKDEVRRILDAAAAAARDHLGAAVDTGRSELAAQLDPDVRTSLTSRAVAELEELHAKTLTRLDPDRSDSHVAKLVAAIEELLGPEGLLAQRLTEAFDSSETDRGLGRVMETVERRFQEMRDLVVGAQSKAEEAARGTAKGVDFEDVVEGLLRTEARALGGCVVERTGLLGGRLGPQTKVGDFVVALQDGTRIVIEAKNVGRLSLTGSTGILGELDEAMLNRDASWGICISRNDAFPAEVGSFALYGKRILVVDPGDGTLLRVALRWAAAAASKEAEPDDKVDTAAAFERLARLRDLAQHFSRSKKALTTAQQGLDGVRDDLDSLRSQLVELVDDAVRALRPPRPDGQVD
ncbi:MAG: hypothetical protein QNJ77_04670 [Acidimicrobiia bacterium]|nr:hypothetical protein [Acidimicrobiia bacterium]